MSSKTMEKPILLMNQLQECGVKHGISGDIDLPSLVVVGAQSAGKSSVLENLMGRDNLFPRGTGIVTKCPLMLQLVHDPEAKEEYAEFGHHKDRTGKLIKILDLTVISTMITDETARRLAEKNLNANDVDDRPIVLRFYSKDVLTLTVVDLPGLTRNPANGQTQGTVDKINEMARKYTSEENALILAVSQASEDIANSQAIALAREVDENLDRTIGVITKLDLMDRGTDCSTTLENKDLVLKRGYVGLVNRGPQDINDGLSLVDGRKKENKFLKKKYPTIYDKHGCEYLQKKISHDLSEHIRLKLPEFQKSLEERLKIAQVKVQTYRRKGRDEQGDCDPVAARESLIAEFLERMNGVIDGKHASPIANECAKDIKSLMHDHFPGEIKDVHTEDNHDELKEEIAYYLENFSPLGCGLFPDNEIFVRLASMRIKSCEQPSIYLVERVRDVYRDFVNLQIHETFSAFPYLCDVVSVFMGAKLQLNFMTARKKVQEFLNEDMAYVTRYYENFLDNDYCRFEGQEIKRGEIPIEMNGEGIPINNYVQLYADKIIIYRDENYEHQECEIKADDMGSATFKFIMHFDEFNQCMTFQFNKRIEFGKDHAQVLKLVPRYDQRGWFEAFSRTDFMELPEQVKREAGIIPAHGDGLSLTAEEKNQDSTKRILLNAVTTYVQVEEKILTDRVPKIIIRSMITQAIDDTRLRLRTEIAKKETDLSLETLMSESEEETATRNKTFAIYNGIKESLQIINKMCKSGSTSSRIRQFSLSDTHKSHKFRPGSSKLF